MRLKFAKTINAKGKFFDSFRPYVKLVLNQTFFNNSPYAIIVFCGYAARCAERLCLSGAFFSGW